MVLLDALLDGVGTEASSGKLRDTCAEALREFLKWAARHIRIPVGSHNGRLAHASENVDASAVLRRVFDRLAHPAASQRHAYF